MKFPQTYTLQQIATIIDADFVGSPEFPVLGMNEIHVVEEGDIVFVDHPKYYDKALQSKATIILINKRVVCPQGKALLISDDPFRDFNKLTEFFKPFAKSENLISKTAKIGSNTVIQPGAFIGNHVIIGKNCFIHANVSIYDDCIIGDNVTIHAGTVLGADAFYYKKRPEGFDKLKSGGRVVIEDDVDLGALCTIDRGVTGDTTIKKGTKIDNQVHIGHDTVIGERCLIASQTGIAGCVVIENEVTIWGQVGVASSITIGSKSIILAQSGISKSLEGGQTYFGYPAEEARKKYKELSTLRMMVSQYGKK
ncbi:UDP-3-O-(3-hydroxymyristoyl)glucosamine N-acyltransferase [Capnocytophaga canimorsus]|uniref:UDP-3-O-(3-hydroxymyristoyl)glucosamine N-acyltransferase n=1 Tax=Capnocytophaga canimorsus TaxID=28188 RepID=UPI001AD4CF7D|nr:UDP-3-O-(3-hydroxymyristoyl)glucosamine N-acyltransferase [Capnocytophaga canimorsus]GIM59252.1 UDP-3-O-(3-hydroxymyristoyl)glucosamine N-acyltransferase [Capnocytophaga canimorsus]